jgi:outer membrane protein assembly factor BamA
VFDLGFPFGIILAHDKKHVNDFYVNGMITHQINASVSHSVSAGHENQLGINSNAIKLNYVRYTVNWKVIRNTLLTTEFFYEDADDSGGFAGFDSDTGLPSGEHLQRYGGALTVGYQLTPHVTLGLRYQYTQKESDLLLRDYTQNRVSLDGTYSF